MALAHVFLRNYETKQPTPLSLFTVSCGGPAPRKQAQWQRPTQAGEMADVPLEVCVDSVASAVAAATGGASRVELCANLYEGGTTPSVGLLRVVLAKVGAGVAVHAMVRPRGGDFLYDADEMSVMREDILAFKQAGAHGVVLGVLCASGTVDERSLTDLVRLAAPLPVTFHRAVDVTVDPVEATLACVRCGVARILSSGGAPEARPLCPRSNSVREQCCVLLSTDATATTARDAWRGCSSRCVSNASTAHVCPCALAPVAQAMQGAATLQRMVAAAAGQLTIAAGGGLSEANACALAHAARCDELHGSLRTSMRSAMSHRPAIPIAMGSEKVNTAESEFEWRQTDAARVAAVVRALAQRTAS